MRGTITKTIIVFLSVIVINSCITDYKVSAEKINTRIIAHRGITRNAPENTIDSIMDAAKGKIEFAELDVQQTKDGEVVLMHDRGIKRLTGINKEVSDVNYSELSGLNIREKNKRYYRKEKIATLEEVIGKAKGKIKLDIEIKPYGKDRELTKKVVSLIEKNNEENQCIITSFDYDALVYAKQLNPNIRTSFLLKSKVKDIRLKDIDIFSVDRHFVSEKLVKDIHKNNKKIHVWTVNDVNEMKKLKSFGVDYIITDNVDGFNNLTKKQEQKQQQIFSEFGKIIGLGSI